MTTRLPCQSPHFLDQGFEKHSSGEINCMDQDDLGFIWIGSSGGLYRYDGYDYRLYSPVDSVKILNITALHFDVHDSLWVGTDAGEIYVIGQDHTLTRWKDDLHSPQMPITGIIRGKDDRLWFSTYGTGLFVQGEGSLDSFTTQDGLWDNEIYAMAIDTLGRTWVATDQGVSICTYERNKRVDNLGTSDGFVDEIVYHLISHKQHMWIGFQSGGIMGYDVVEDSLITPRKPWSWGETTGMILAQTEDLWLGTSEGLVRYNLNTHDIGLVRMENNRMQGLSFLFHDSQDNMWCVTNKSKLSCANMLVESVHAEIGDVQAVLADKSGQVWIGTSSGLLRYLPGSFLKISQFSDNVISLYEDAFGHIWIGTFGAGVIIWDPITDRSRRLSESHGLKNGSVLSIDGDDERVWLATLGGIVEVQQHKDLLQQQIRFLQLDEINDLAVSFFYTVFVDNHGDAWFGTDGKGVIKLESEVLISMQDKHAFPAKTVYTLCEDDQGNIWIGTATEGLYKWDGDVFSQYDVLDGNRNLPISILAVDVNGHIVIGHSEGIDIFDPFHELILPYRDEVGVNQLDPTMNALCKNKEGIWIGGLNKLILLRPDKDGNRWPKLVVDDIKILGNSVSRDVSGSFNSFANYTQFDVVGLWYGRTDALTYAYKLEGYDMEWHESSDRRISFGQLMPGNYTFNVAPVVADKKLEDHLGSYSFIINPPYWKKPWFVALSLILLAITLWWYQKFREARISKKVNLAKERIESQYEVLKAQINPHFLFNSFNTLASIVEENTPQAIEYIETLSDYYRSIIQLRDQKLIKINEELDMVNDYVFLLNKRFGAHLRFENHMKNIHGWIPPLSLQMLVENAIKHNIISQRKPLHISIRRTSDDYILVTNNLQPKRTKPDSTKFGLQNIQKRFEILSKKKVIIEHSNTKFIVRIPVINKDIP